MNEPETKLKPIRKASRYSFPTADIEQILSQIEPDYQGSRARVHAPPRSRKTLSRYRPAMRSTSWSWKGTGCGPFSVSMPTLIGGRGSAESMNCQPVAEGGALMSTGTRLASYL